MSIAWPFTPSAAHTFIGEYATHSLIPRSLIGISRLAFVGVGFPFIPGNSRTNPNHVVAKCYALLFGNSAILMTRDIQAFPPSGIKSRPNFTTTTFALYGFHDFLHSLIEYIIPLSNNGGY